MATPNPSHPCLSAFRDGFARVHVAAPLVAAVLVVMAAWGIERFVAHGGWGRLPVEHVLRSSQDDWMWVTHRVSQLEAPQANRKRIYLMGGSSAREMCRAPVDIVAQMAEDHGLAIEWLPFCTSAQSLGECLVMLDHLPEGGGVLLICINPVRFNFGPEAYLSQARGERLRLPSPTLSAFLAAESLPATRARWAVPGAGRWINEITQVHAAALQTGNLGGKTYVPYRYAVANMHSLKAKQKFLRTYKSEIRPRVHEHYSFNLRALELLLARAREKGLAPVLLEMPLTPMARDVYQPEIDLYQEGVSDLAAQYAAQHLQCAAGVNFRDDDFFDLTHLVARGRERYEPHLLAAVADALNFLDEDAP